MLTIGVIHRYIPRNTKKAYSNYTHRVNRPGGYVSSGATVIEEETHTYDAAGNILTATSLDGSTTTYTYGVNNELLSINGNQWFHPDYRLRSDYITGAHYNDAGGITYDSYDRVKRVNGDYNEYWYDADGNRADMFYYSTNMMYTWDSSDGMNRLVWTKDHLLNTTIYGYGPDGLVWSLCDGNYNGQYGVLTDPNGMLYMRSRFYSPYLKRFMTCDIIKEVYS